MPNYIYKCPTCGSKQEIDHSMVHNPTILCLACKTPTVRLPGVGYVSFKGTGWGKDR